MVRDGKSSISIARLLYPVMTLGPGKRLAVWTSGCSKRCLGCANPELWEADPSQRVSVFEMARQLIQLSERKSVRRVTFSGGDPFEQAEALLELLALIRPHYADVLVYTGYTTGELQRLLGFELDQLREFIDVLIDGPYVQELNDGEAALRGSTNQNIHLLNPALRDEYEAYLAGGREVQNFHYDGKVLSVGIHNREGQQ